MAGVLGLFFGTGEDIKSRSNSDIMTASQQGSKYVASIDQGTSSSRCIIFGRDGSIVSEHQMEHEQFYPLPGRVEHDADEIWVGVKPYLMFCQVCFLSEALQTPRCGSSPHRSQGS